MQRLQYKITSVMMFPTLINHGVPASVIVLLILSSLVLANAKTSNDSPDTPEYNQNFTGSVLSIPLKQNPEVTLLLKKFLIESLSLVTL
ncbi:MAG: hypothetical protein ACK5WP_03460 [Neisseriaceae bacterium]